MTDEQRINFERAFNSGTAGCSKQCACNKYYYNPDPWWDWEEGELEDLYNSDAIEVEHSVGSIYINDVKYVDACDCWHKKAGKIIEFLETHAHQIKEFYKLEKDRKHVDYQNSVIIDDEHQTNS